MEQLLLDAEKTLYFISCLMPLVYTTDFERNSVEVCSVLETVGEMADKTRQRITDALISMHIQKEQRTD